MFRTSIRGFAATLAVAVVAPAGAQAACHHTDVMPNAHMREARAATICLLNAQRRHHGLANLRVSPKLSRASERHSLSMVHSHYFQHGDFMGRILHSGYLINARSWTVGENIAWGGGGVATPASIVSMWMHSPGHRANILSGSYREIGIGIVAGTPQGGQGGTYTTDFGRRG